MSEDRLIGWLRREIRRHGHDLLGDDAAFLEREAWAVSVDQQIEGTHFPPGTPAATVARRLLAVNLSDLAAVGAAPAYALLTVAAPRGYRLRTFLRAFLAAAHDHGTTLAGGDVARAERAAFGLTVFGRRQGRWLRREDGRSGDRLWVGGSLGESAAGRFLLARGARSRGGRIDLPPDFPADRRLAAAARRAVRRHLLPAAQLDLGRWLAGRRRAAAIDVSDGLLLDLERLCRASGAAGRIDAAALPLAHEAERLAGFLGVDAVELAATGGEDYALLFALPASISPPPGLGCHPIGRLVPGAGVQIDAGQRYRARGWDHLT